MMANNEIKNAIYSIRHECEKHSRCMRCPLFNYDTLNCNLCFNPKSWNYTALEVDRD